MSCEKSGNPEDSQRFYQELRKEERLYPWGEPQTHISGRPHHLAFPQWAGELQRSYGAHRRGPTRR